MASTLKHCKTRAKPDVTPRSPRATSDGLRAARPLAHAPSPPRRANLRWLATSPTPLPDPQPPRRRHRRLSCAPRGHQVRPALPVPRGHRRCAAPDSNTIVDELRQLGLVSRRRSASSWVDCSATGSDTTRGELGVCARREGCTRSAQAPRSGGDRVSRLARVRVGRAPMCHRRRAASSRTLVWRRAPVLSAAPARKSKPAAPCRPCGQHVAGMAQHGA